MNAFEINLALCGLQCLESELCAQWEKAQKAHPYGAKASWCTEQLKEVRRLADKLAEMHKTAD